MIRSKHIALVSVWLACAGAVALPARSAKAQDQAAVDKLVQMNKKALDDYDTLDWDAAKRILLDALVAGKKAGLDNHPVMARTYIHLGAIYITGFKDKQKGMQSFARALEIDPTIQLSKGIETAEVTAAFAEAQRNARGGGASSGGGDDSQPPPPTKKKRRGPIMEGDAPPPSSRSQGGAARRGRRRARSARAYRRARLPRAGRGDHRQAAHPALRARRQLAGGQRVPDVPGAGQGGLHRGPHDQDAQGLVAGQDPQEGRQRQVVPVLLRGTERRRQAGRRQRRRRQPEHRSGGRGGVEERGLEGRNGRRAGGEPAR